MSKTAKEAPLTSSQVRDRRVADVAQMAAKAFAEHVIEPLWFGLPVASGRPIEAHAWLCWRPGHSEYQFTLYAVRNRLIVCGDIGTLVVERCPDMLAWARGSVDSIAYFAEKVVSEIDTEEFDPDMVRAFVHETDQDVLNDERSEAFVKDWIGETRRALLEAIDDGEYAVLQAYGESSLNDGDPPHFDNWKYGFLWTREAIKWFLARWRNAA